MSETLNDTLYDSLLTTEGFIQTIYKDSEGVPTIGVGMALLNKKADGTYEQFADIDKRLASFLPEENDEQKRADVISALNDAMAALNGDTSKVNPFKTPSELSNAETLAQEMAKYGGFSSSDDFKNRAWNGTDIKLSNDYIEDAKEAVNNGGLNNWDKLSIEEQTSIASIVYNGGKGAIGNGTRTAIDNYVNATDDASRAAAKLDLWYEVACNTNKDKDDGIAKRRFFEGLPFQIDTSDPAEKQAVIDAFLNDNFAEKLNKLIEYEKQFYEQVDKAVIDYHIDRNTLCTMLFGSNPWLLEILEELMETNPEIANEILKEIGIEDLPILSDTWEDFFIIHSMPINLFGSKNTYEEINTSIKNLINTGEETRSPLVVDLDGDGVETTTTEDGTHFDHDNNGFAEKTSWVGKDDGLLVRDLNNNGQIDDGTELFGNNSVLSSGEKAANGFEALADLDSNEDNIFNNQDTVWNQVKVWKDANSNGIVDEGELLTLEQAGIESIDLDYQNSNTVDANGNTVGQIGTFDKENGTQGNISDIWFNTDLMDTVDKTNIDIPADIAALPNVSGFGNVHDLHTAMVLDTTGALKTLVQQYVAETNTENRQTILYNIIYHWSGVQNEPIDGRDPTQVYGKVIDDTRKLEALEEFMGEEYLGTWCWGERDPNPHGKAAPYILQAFEELKGYAGNQLNAQSHYKNLMDNIKLVYNSTSQSWTVDISSALPILQNLYTAAGTESLALLEDINAMIKSYDSFSEQVIAAFVAAGSSSGSAFEADLLNFGNFGSQGTSLSERLYGTDNDNYLNGYAGNDHIYGYDGNDLIVGGNGDDFLVGGNGADTYHFDIGFGNDSIDNTDNDASNENPDIIRFGEGILPSYVTLVRHGYDLIVRVTYPDASRPVDSVRVLSYFDEQTTTSAAINKIQFSDEDETVWDKNYIDEHWNITTSAGGGTVAEGDDNANTLYGTSKDDVLIGNGGNDTLYADAGNDIISGGQGNDRLVGNNGDDSYLWNLGDGLDTIEENAGRDKIIFGEGITFDDLSFEAYFNGGTGQNTGLAIYVKGDKTQGIIITSQFYNYIGENQIEELHFADGSKVMLTDIPLTLHQTDIADRINLTDNGDTVYAAGGNDTINGGAGNDTIYGEAGDDILSGGGGNNTIIGGLGNDEIRNYDQNSNDIYIWNLGDGLDTITDNGGTDKIVFGEGISFSDLTFQALGDPNPSGIINAPNLKIYVKGDENQGIIINGVLSSYPDGYFVETLEFSDGSTVNLKDISITLHQTDNAEVILLPHQGAVIYAAGGNDEVSGRDGADTIYGGAGDDILSGGGGNNTIIGGLGNDEIRNYDQNSNDIYIWNLGDGLDTITDNGGTDKIVFGEGITQNDLSFEQIGNNLKISINGDEIKGLQINNHFSSSANQVESIEFADGTTLDLTNADQLIQAMNSFGAGTSSTMDILSNPTESVSDMCNLAAGSDLIKKAV